MVKVDNKRQPMKASMLPGKTKGNAMGSGPMTMADGRGGVTGKKQPAFGVSTLPGSFVSMEAGADPSKNLGLNNGPAGDASQSDCQMGSGQKNRTVTSRDQSPYDVK